MMRSIISSRLCSQSFVASLVKGASKAASDNGPEDRDVDLSAILRLHPSSEKLNDRFPPTLESLDNVAMNPGMFTQKPVKLLVATGP